MWDDVQTGQRLGDVRVAGRYVVLKDKVHVTYIRPKEGRSPGWKG